MSYLLDTNVVSEIRKRRPDPNARAWWDATASRDLHLSVLVLGEIRQGVERRRRRDPGAADQLDRWLAELVERFADRILDVDAAVADRWGLLNVPDQLPTIDGLLAATALVHGMVLVTRNVEDVRRTGVTILDPFEPIDA